MTTNLQPAKTMNIAHRGASSMAPENTLAAARKALELGADMWELDVGLTADGVLVLGHDDSLERTSNVTDLFPERASWLVSDFTLAEIRQLDRGSWFIDQDRFGQIAAGNISQAELDQYVGVPTPTLEEALLFTRENEWRVNVEIKHLVGAAAESEVVEQAVALVESLAMADRVLISSFNHRYLKRVKRANPKIATGALVGSAPADPLTMLRRLEAQAYHPRNSIVQPEEIRSLRRQGFAVNVWTVNDEALMRTLIEADVSGILTDFPQRLAAVLAEYR